MQSVFKYLLVFVCAAFICVSCNSTEEVNPATQNTPEAISSRVTDDILQAGDVVTPGINNGTITYSYQVEGNSNTSRTWIKVSDFAEGCSCSSDCPRLIIKDINNNTILDTNCQPLTKYVRVPGNYFSVTIYDPSWMTSNGSDVNIQIQSW
ncbi:hypothetical protein [Microscilla marina]|uniref:Lipoprotein n=1 Tax=Microscilla marina ATCC 23134 TaxID=313606 RepID=A1ZGA8_MICM2|nr:hypothetical protein [Microscilla marina]EAY30525.1 hypothetical protein M23134_03161 [Microscilla marina ATCC 23134]